MEAIHVYQSPLTGHWLVDLIGTRECPSHRREGYRNQADALVGAWEEVQKRPGAYSDVVVQK